MVCAINAVTLSPTLALLLVQLLKCASSVKKSLREKNLKTFLKEDLSPLEEKWALVLTNLWLITSSLTILTTEFF